MGLQHRYPNEYKSRHALSGYAYGEKRGYDAGTVSPYLKNQYAYSLFWVPIGILAVILLTGQLLTGRYRFLSTTTIILILTIALALEIYTYFEENRKRFRRALFATVLLVATVTVVEVDGVANLVLLLVTGGRSIHGPPLLLSGLYYWASNVLAFGLWFWLIDRGGPPMRARGSEGPAEFFFPEMAAGDIVQVGWTPGLAEYLYLAFTNATAFSPTDTLPLSSRARLLMTAEAVISLVVIALITARAVNILS